MRLAMAAIAILMVGTSHAGQPHQSPFVRRHTAEVVEVNTFYSVDTEALRNERRYVAKEVMTQLIWWDWSHVHERYVVRDWRLIGKADIPLSERGGWVVRWKDEKNRRWREVKALDYWRTNSLYDPEAEDRSVVEPKDRKLFD